MQRVEGGAQGRGGGGFDERQGERMGLAGVAAIGKCLPAVAFGQRRAQSGAQLVPVLREGGITPVGFAAQQRAGGRDFARGVEHAIGREQAGLVGKEHVGAAERVGERAGVQSTGAAECDEGEGAGVDATGHGDALAGAGHVALDERDDGFGGLFDAGAELGGEAGDGSAGGGGVEREGTAEQRWDAAEHDVGVGDGGLGGGAGFAVAGRAGPGTGRAGADAQGAAGVDECDRAAAGADGLDRQQRHAQRVGVEHAIVFGRERAAHNGDIGRGATHVKGQERGAIAATAGMPCAAHAAGGAGEHGVDRGGGGFGGGEQAAGGSHDGEVTACCASGDDRAEVGEVGAHDRGEEGIDGDGGKPLVLARYRGEGVRGGDGTAGEGFGERGGDEGFVGAIGVAVEQADGKGFGAVEGGVVVFDPGGDVFERFDDRAGVIATPADAEHVIRWDERRRHFGVERVEVRSGLAAQAEGVFEAMVGDAHDPGAAAFEERVGRDGGAMVYGRGLWVAGDAGERVEREQHRAARVVGRRWHLEPGEAAVFAAGDEVGEGAAGVDGDAWGHVARMVAEV